jgi:hypothetical protein
MIGMFEKLNEYLLPGNEDRTRLMAQLIGTSLMEGMYIVKCLNRVLSVEGDICEFGVAQGATSAFMANEIRWTEKHIWLFDSFKGLPRPSRKDYLINDIFELGSMDAYEGKMASPEYLVRQRLMKIQFPPERTHVVSGFFPASATTNAPDKICFSYIDFDLYQPILDALHFVDQRMPPGGCITVDDYGWFSRGVQQAVDEFRANNARFELHLPQGEHFAILQKM